MGGTVARPVAVVTGAGAGLGLAITQRLWHDGWAVIGVDYADPSKDVADLLERSSGAIQMMSGDVRSPATCERAGQLALEQFGQVNALVNNAAIDGPFGMIEDIAIDEVIATLEVNVVGAFVFCRGLIPALKQAQGVRRIVNMGSCFGLTASPQLSAYNASKAALHSLTQTAALELAEHQVTVNMIAPGYVRTAMLERDAESRSDGSKEDVARILQEMADRVPLGRLGTPRDVAALVSWLLAPDASYITGQTIGINGGFLLS